ncbi:non-ribosomal peptide synthetase [Chitinophaga rhizophila]|uniref:Amino acid adenylation domain-containing protein n=1 Tax=Chitinophaga rhizophila TaxID=2866212 RepID=A0ABS7GHM8_9BACT|nr:non-ribosomal peptide synthetase [Chitinophaga rhizophila]MBW8687204.1 amino acid adenylation domain-containing protein [Chitinophaga rhizophila]
MTISSILARLKSLKIQLSLEGDTLKLVPPAGTVIPSDLLTAVRATKQDIIAWIKSMASINRIERADLGALVPLSENQLALWPVVGSGDGISVYNMPVAYLLKGAFSVAVLQQAINAVVAKHDSLRTTFVIEGDIPFQKVHAPAAFNSEITVYDGTAYAEEQINSLLAQLADEPFDLFNGPLFRVVIVQLSDDRNIYFLNTHHLISDGWSLGIFTKELLERYNALLAGRDIVLPDNAIRYGDFVSWQQSVLASPDGIRQQAYWQQQLSDITSLLPLPYDIMPVGLKSYSGSIKVATVPARDLHDFRSLCADMKVSTFMGLFAVLNTLLYRYTGEERLVLGAPAAARVHADLHDIIGLFANTLPISTTLNDTVTFRELLLSVKESITDAYDNQFYPLNRLLAQSDGNSPLFNVMVVYQQDRDFYEQLPIIEGLEVTTYPLPVTTSKFDLSFVFVEKQDTLEIGIEYNRNVFLEETIHKLLDHFVSLMRMLTVNTDVAISRVSFLETSELDRLLYVLNPAIKSAPEAISIGSLIDQQAAVTPDLIALSCDNQSISYRELVSRSTDLAAHLLRKGLQCGELVGIYTSRSIDMVVGMLGILKAGGAYVPLDPEYPQQRNLYYLADSQARFLLTEKALAGELDAFTGNRIILEESGGPISADMAIPWLPQVAVEQTAYIIYTSGSSGVPKGVSIRHENVFNLLSWARRTFDTGERERMLACTSICFDLSVYEIFFPLSCGHQVVLVKNALSLLTAGSRPEVTIINTVPSAIRHLLAEKAIPPSVKVVNLAGEELKPELVKSLYEQCGHIQHVFNLYGPSETCTYSTWLKTDWQSLSINIGFPVDNTHIYIMDKNRQLLPEGAIGEIYIGGLGVAEGYHNRPDITRERFIDNPFHVGGKMYKTGDLGRWTIDGRLEYKGRIDEQVKIRGFRIECGEVENVIRQHHAITGVVVLGYDSGDGKSLAACFTAESPVSESDMKAFLAGKLPGFMVPQLFQQLEVLPLTNNGKVDKKKLVAGIAQQERAGMEVAARNLLDHELQDIWREVLPGSPVGITDNLFSVGSSITLARLLTRINRRFKLDLTMISIWQYPTIQALSDYMAASAGNVLPPIVPSGRADYYPATPGQKRIWMQCELDGSDIFNITTPFLIKGDLDITRLENAWQRLSETYEILRTNIDLIDGKVVQIIHPGDTWQPAFDYTDLRSAEDSTAVCAAIFNEVAARQYNLKEGPLAVMHVCQLEDRTFRICLVIHHVITDGWSIHLLLRSLITLYQGEALPVPAFQYRDFSVWYEQILLQEQLSTATRYWRNQLPDEIPVLHLPVQAQQLPETMHTGRTAQFRLTDALMAAWDKYIQSKQATRFSGLLSLIALLLHRYCDAEQMIIGTVHAGRPLQELEDTPGMFVHTLPLVVNVDAQKNFADLLQANMQVTMEAFAYQMAPLDDIIEEKYGFRRKEQPLFNVSVVLQNYTEAITFPGISELDITAEWHEVERSEYDLSFIFQEDEKGVTMNVEYRTALFTQDVIARMHAHLESLINAIVTSPDSPVYQLDYLLQDEKNWLIHTINDTRVVHPEKTVLQLLADQAEASAESIALIEEDHEITYRELVNLSDRLAAYLKYEANIKPGEVVAIYMDRSIAAIVCMFAIMKAGAVYMPVDTTYPGTRVKYMLNDAAVVAVIADTAERINDISLPVILYSDVMEVGLANVPDKWPVDVSLADTAYIMYTSGSTGKPKGIPITHLSLTDYICSIISYLPLDRTHTVLQQASLAFDTSIEEIFPVLCAGGQLVICREGGADIEGLLQLIQKYSVTFLSAAPLVINELNDYPDRLSSLRYIISAGEELKPAYITRLKSMTIHNLYGPTESTVSATWHKVEDISAAGLIGRPMYNRSILLLDRHMQLTPIGIKGEIYIGGVGLTKGYLNRPELTAERFVPHPFAAGETLYRTGDIGVWQPDGNLKFLGRVDDQVQIRGNRVELGEIEKVLLEFGSISEVFVFARETADGDKYVAAYYVSAAAIDNIELRQHMLASLPSYMIPAVFIHMDSFPLNASGKLDRSRLPAADIHIVRNQGKEAIQPANELEAAIVKMWEEVLHIDNISTTDNFFELGGNSLKVIRLFKLLSAAYPGVLSIGELFVYGTVQQLCALLSERLNLKVSAPTDVFEEFEL